jgi:hypothetical protein
VRIGLLEPGESDQIECRARAPQALGRRHPAGFERERHVADCHPPRQQTVVLEHVADLAPIDRAVGASAHHDHAAGVRRKKPGGEVEERRLARAGRPENGDDLARRNIEAHVAQHLELTTISRRKLLGDVLERNGAGVALVRSHDPSFGQLRASGIGDARHVKRS